MGAVLGAIASALSDLKALKPLIAVFYLANLAAGLTLAWPLLLVLDDFAGHSLEGARLAQGVDFDFLVELIHYNPAALSILLGLLLPVSIAYWLLSLFLSGGALSLFVNGTGFGAAFFWGSAARQFRRLLLLSFFMVPLLAGLLFSLLLAQVLFLLLMGPDASQPAQFWWLGLLLALLAAGLALIRLVFDYARIEAVRGEASLGRCFGNGLRFVLQRPGWAIGSAAILSLLSLAVLALGKVLSAWLSAPLPLAAAGLIAVQQAVILARTVLRLTRLGSQAHLAKRMREPVSGDA